MMIKQLYVIGNGFDLHHRIDSRYSDFHKWLIEKTRFGYLYADEIEPYFCCEDFWYSFEENLAKFRYEEFAKDVAKYNRPNMMSDHAEASLEDARVEVENQLDPWWKELKALFKCWIEQLGEGDITSKVDIQIENSFFLSFNYTLTLERLYGVPSEQILHIHGKVGCSFDTLYLGHGGDLLPRSETRFDGYEDEYGNIDYSMFPDANDELSERQAVDAGAAQVIRWQKPVKEIISNNAGFWYSLRSVDSVNVLGLGFSSVDMPYLQIIKENVVPWTRWVVSCYSDFDRTRFESKLLQIGVKNVEFIKLNDLKIPQK